MKSQIRKYFSICPCQVSVSIKKTDSTFSFLIPPRHTDRTFKVQDKAVERDELIGEISEAQKQILLE